MLQHFAPLSPRDDRGRARIISYGFAPNICHSCGMFIQREPQKAGSCHGTALAKTIVGLRRWGGNGDEMAADKSPESPPASALIHPVLQTRQGPMILNGLYVESQIQRPFPQVGF